MFYKRGLITPKF